MPEMPSLRMSLKFRHMAAAPLSPMQKISQRDRSRTLM